MACWSLYIYRTQIHKCMMSVWLHNVWCSQINTVEMAFDVRSTLWLLIELALALTDSFWPNLWAALGRIRDTVDWQYIDSFGFGALVLCWAQYCWFRSQNRHDVFNLANFQESAHENIWYWITCFQVLGQQSSSFVSSVRCEVYIFINPMECSLSARAIMDASSPAHTWSCIWMSLLWNIVVFHLLYELHDLIARSELLWNMNGLHTEYADALDTIIKRFDRLIVSQRMFVLVDKHADASNTETRRAIHIHQLLAHVCVLEWKARLSGQMGGYQGGEGYRRRRPFVVQRTWMHSSKSQAEAEKVDIGFLVGTNGTLLCIICICPIPTLPRR